MTSYAQYPTRVDAQALCDAQDKLLKYPRGPTGRVVGKRPVFVESWDRKGPVPLGWSTYRDAIIPRADAKAFAVPVDEQSAPKLSRDSTLTLQEKQQIQTALDTATDLPQDWTGADVLSEISPLGKLS